ncbi:Dam family site-specific DNA-(adenine-N6)-methyltransferase [Erysipelothrix rhusiopathiae]|nr:Dam family site-specific DNA-(adenine-N6)-methyltransferase [Erysipelothrix rhusiopathiae]MDE9421729.1 Dam family site-specific DNA-(adenine-N6)-methyltransferase [Erysipelothrix rhusiopathiae]
MELLLQFGNKIKSIREEKNMSQSTLSEKSGLVREQISRIENGQINATIETIFKLSLGLDTSMKEIMSFSNELFTEIKSQDYLKEKPKPFVKWAGGKTQLLDKIKGRMPEKYNTYYEPFIGGGALLFNITPRNAVINDFNSELISTYKSFQNKKELAKLIELLKNHENNHSEEYFYKIREMDRVNGFKELSSVEKAARFVYLNKAGFNGLYRVNKKGQFNVPSGKKLKVNTFDSDNFKKIYEYFSDANISVLNGDFQEAVSNAQEGDFVYFDPPYDSFDEKESFTSYSKAGFGREEQFRLSTVFKELSNRGVKVMLSNHNTKYIQELYKDFNIEIIFAKRMINSKANGRGNVEEVLITNY